MVISPRNVTWNFGGAQVYRKLQTLTPSDRTRVPSTSYEELSVLSANTALARIDIPVDKPTPFEP